jgi:hypothetical protein
MKNLKLKEIKPKKKNQRDLKIKEKKLISKK